jgi:hypothetical protein
VTIDSITTLQFSNSCEAECHGYVDYVPCPAGCPCPEYYAPVCAIGPNNDTLQFDNVCFAACEGYMDVFPCDNNCVCPTVYDPVCVVTPSGAIITFGNSCEAECAGYYVYFPCNGIPESHLGGQPKTWQEPLKAYPNPTDGNVTIETDLPDGSIISYRLLDLNGKELWRMDVASRNVQIDISGFMAGLYLIHAESMHGVQFGRVVLK